MTRTHASGFTLIELVVMLAIAAAVVGIATAAVGDGLEASRAAQARTHLLESLNLAAHRAGLTGTHAVVCATNDGATCSGVVDWTPGWIAFLDTNEDGQRAPAEPTLAVVPGLQGQVRLRSTPGRTRVVYQGNGGNAGSNLTFTLCDGRGPAKARSLVLSNAGRVRDEPASAEAAAATCPP